MKTPDLRSLWPRLRHAGRVFTFAMALLGMADLVGLLCNRYVRINLSPSLPLGLYRPVALPLAADSDEGDHLFRRRRPLVGAKRRAAAHVGFKWSSWGLFSCLS